MSLAIISEAYFLDSDSETGDGNDDPGKEDESPMGIHGAEAKLVDTEGDEDEDRNDSLIDEWLAWPDNLGVGISPRELFEVGEGEVEGNASPKIDGVQHRSNNLEMESDSEISSSSRATEIVSGEEETQETSFMGNVIEPEMSPPPRGGPVRDTPRRKRKRRVGNWMWSYRKRQQSNGKVRRTKVRSRLRLEVDPIREQELTDPISGSRPEAESSSSVGGEVEMLNPSSTSLKRTRKQSTSLARHECPKCCASFSVRRRLLKHMELHSGIRRRWKCSRCGCNFTSKNSLRSHEGMRHGRDISSINKCATCKVQISSRKYFENHMKTHTETERKWKCPDCPSFFNRLSDLSTHEKRVHKKKLEQGPFSCPKCGKQFAEKYNALRHIRMVHGFSETRAVSELMCGSYPGQETAKFLSWQYALSLLPTCNLMLTRCDHLVSQYARSTLSPVKFQKKANPKRGQANTKKVQTSCEDPRNQKRARENCVKTFSSDNQKQGQSSSTLNMSGKESQDVESFQPVTDGESSDQDELLYTCPYCFKSFPEPNLLITHLPIHNVMDQQQMEIHEPAQIQIAANKAEELTATVPVVKSTSSNKCRKCNYSCRSAQALRNHEELYHKRTKQSRHVAPVHNCPSCSYSSRALSTLMFHMELHKEEGRPFRCLPCRYTFKTVQGLRAHENRMHPGFKSPVVPVVLQCKKQQ